MTEDHGRVAGAGAPEPAGTRAARVGAVGDVVTGGLLWRYAGQLHQCIAVRARYVLNHDGVAARSATRGVSGLAAADDPVPYRQGCDVWMVGHCNGSPRAQLSQTMGSLPGEVALTTRLSLFGGREQLIDRQHRLMHGSDVGVAGYGPRRTGTWLAELTVDGVVEIPQSFDWTQLHAAPVSQRIRYLDGSEMLTLEGVLEQRGAMRCRLPRDRGAVRVWGRDSRPSDAGYPVHLVADTLGIDSDAAALTIVWRGSFPIDDVDAPNRMLIAAGVETDDEPIDWEEAWIIAHTTTVIGDARTTRGTLELPAQPATRAPVVPFTEPSEALRPASIVGAPWSEREPRHDAAASGSTVPPRRERAMTLDLNEALGRERAQPALPFQAPAPPPEGAPPIDSPPPFSATDPVFDIASMETVETPPHDGEQPVTPFEESGSWSRADEDGSGD